jgi:hypothetical protein
MQYQPSGSVLQKASVTLSSAQILTIFTTPVNVIPAPPTGMTNILLSATLNYLFGGTAYTDGGGHLLFRYNGVPQVNATAGFTTGVNFWTGAVDAYGMLPGTSFGGIPVVRVESQPIAIQQDTANPTLGNGTIVVTANFITVTAS